LLLVLLLTGVFRESRKTVNRIRLLPISLSRLL
jgi:hypothetical protein